MIRRRTFGHSDGPDMNDEGWHDAPLVTPRNPVKPAWNNQAALPLCVDTWKAVIISPLLDEGIRCNRTNMTWTVDSRTEFLATWNVLCIDGLALVISNIAGSRMEVKSLSSK